MAEAVHAGGVLLGDRWTYEIGRGRLIVKSVPVRVVGGLCSRARPASGTEPFSRHGRRGGVPMRGFVLWGERALPGTT